jgi:hypothetical protein
MILTDFEYAFRVDDSSNNMPITWFGVKKIGSELFFIYPYVLSNDRGRGSYSNDMRSYKKNYIDKNIRDKLMKSVIKYVDDNKLILRNSSLIVERLSGALK